MKYHFTVGLVLLGACAVPPPPAATGVDVEDSKPALADDAALADKDSAIEDLLAADGSSLMESQNSGEIVDVYDSAFNEVPSGDAATALDLTAPDIAAIDGGPGDSIAPQDSAADAVVPMPDAPTACACGDGACAAGCGETAASCAADCKSCGDGVCSAGEGPKVCAKDCCGKCGDGVCVGYACGENPETCPGDCGSACGNGSCDNGESPQNCAEDCQWQLCGNGVCEGSDGGSAACPQDCSTACGNCSCDKGETFLSCPVDCGWCGDGVCSMCVAGGESLLSCPADCGKGECKPGSAGACDDNNSCTTDQCSPAGNCAHLPKVGPCDDSNACSVGDACTAGLCVPGSPAACDDGNPCTDDSCASQVGCSHAANAKTCNDGNACSAQDQCAAGSCAGLVSVDCSDGKACTLDVCKAATGCSHTKLSGPACNDGDACTAADACLVGACGGVAVLCADGNPCTNDACLPASGCTATANEATCNDGDKCTTADACAGGTCAGKPASCDDANPCTQDTCQSGSGCQHAALPDLTSCVAVCTPGACVSGTCVATGASPCDDGNPCTQDVCDLLSGCTHKVLSDGASCTDACQVAACKGGSCSASSKTNCDDGDACLVDACDPLTGCLHTPAISIKPYEVAGEAEAIAALPAGGLVLVGKATPPKSSNYDLWATKLDDNGGMQWSKTFGSQGAWQGKVAWDFGQAVVVRPDGDILVAGTTLSKGAGLYDFWLLRLSGAGTLLGDWTYGGWASDTCSAIVQFPDGYLLGGTTESKGAGKADLWLVRVDLNGAVIWDKTLGGVGVDGETALAALPAGGAVVVGSTFELFATVLVARVDAGGKVVWQVKLPAKNLNARSVAVVGDSVLVATSASLVRLDLAGSVVWTRSLATMGLQNAGDILAGQNGGILLAGLSNQVAAMARLDAAGIFQSLRTYSDTMQGTKPTQMPRALHTSAATILSYGCCGQHWIAHTNGWGDADCATVGNCLGLQVADCQDNNPCTTDDCDGAKGCQHKAATCDDGNACTAESCSPANGCTSAPVASGTLCSGSGGDKVCDAGVCACTPTAMAKCDDKNVCTWDDCSGGGGCSHGSVPCDDNNPCTVDTCVATKGCTYANASDGTVCKFDKSCKAGTCQ